MADSRGQLDIAEVEQDQDSVAKLKVVDIPVDDVDAKSYERTSLQVGNIGDHILQRQSSVELVESVKESFEKTQPSEKRSLSSRIIKPIKTLFSGKSSARNSAEREVVVEYVPAVGVEAEKWNDTTKSIYYKMDYHFLGRVVVIDEAHFEYHQDLSDRDGSNLDAKKLHEVCRKIGFKKEHIDVVNSVRLDVIVEKLNAAAKKDYTDYGMFMCVILTHGESGYLHAADKLFPVDRLWEPFTEENCPSLRGKPKVFIIQACRGTRLDPGIDVKDPKGKYYQDDTVDGLSDPNTPSSSQSNIESLDTLEVPNIKDQNRRCSESGVALLEVIPPVSGVRRTSLPLEALKAQLMLPNPQVRRSSFDQVDANPSDDVKLNSPHSIPDTLVAYSTIDGYYSFRRPTTGSWFIQTVCDKLEELYKTEDLMSIMTRASCFIATDMMSYVSDRNKQEFHQKKQVPCIASTFTKLLRFPKKK